MLPLCFAGALSPLGFEPPHSPLAAAAGGPAGLGQQQQLAPTGSQQLPPSPRSPFDRPPPPSSASFLAGMHALPGGPRAAAAAAANGGDLLVAGPGSPFAGSEAASPFGAPGAQLGVVGEPPSPSSRAGSLAGPGGGSAPGTPMDQSPHSLAAAAAAAAAQEAAAPGGPLAGLPYTSLQQAEAMLK